MNHDFIRKIADGTFEGFQKHAAAILCDNSSPETVDQANQLKAVCTEHIRMLRAAKADVVRWEITLKEEILAGSLEDRRRLAHERSACEDTRVHIDALIVEVEESKQLAKKSATELVHSKSRLPAPSSPSSPQVLDDERAWSLLDELREMGVLSSEEVLRARERMSQSPDDVVVADGYSILFANPL